MPRLRLMIPGPVDCSPSVLRELGRQTMAPVGAEWLALYSETLAACARLFGTASEVLIVPGSGTTGLDISIASLLGNDASLAVVTNGFFGRRLAIQARSLGVPAHEIVVPPDEVPDPCLVRHKLQQLAFGPARRERPIRALAFVHHETSTGTVNPIRELAQIARELGLLSIVDAVSSLGGEAVEADRWGLDCCVAVPNKGIAAPPGAAIIALSENALLAAEQNLSPRSWSTSLRVLLWHRRNVPERPYPGTPPTNVVRALRRALAELDHEGLQARRSRMAKVALRIREAMGALGFAMYPAPEAATVTQSVFRCPPNVDIAQLLDLLATKNRILITRNLDTTTPELIRVGHMGRATDDEYVEALIHGLREHLDR